MLTEVRRPDLPACFETSINLPKVAWKTGASYGHRDAWSVGYTPEYTIGVRVGNFDGVSSPSLVGSEVAAPILFALFNVLTTSATNQWFARPYQVQTRKMCALSGIPLSVHCPTSKVDYYIPCASSNTPYSTHKLIAIDNQTGSTLCSHCWIGRPHRQLFLLSGPRKLPPGWTETVFQCNPFRHTIRIAPALLLDRLPPFAHCRRVASITYEQVCCLNIRKSSWKPLCPIEQSRFSGLSMGS